MKVILSVPDEGYFERTCWRLFWAYLMKVILSVPNEGYFERTWWRLFQKHVVRTKFDIYASITVILLTCGNYWYDGIVHYEGRFGPIKISLPQHFFLLKCLEQARKVSCHVRFFNCSNMVYFFPILWQQLAKCLIVL